MPHRPTAVSKIVKARPDIFTPPTRADHNIVTKDRIWNLAARLRIGLASVANPLGGARRVG
jgi:hypothetical protein